MMILLVKQLLPKLLPMAQIGDKGELFRHDSTKIKKVSQRLESKIRHLKSLNLARRRKAVTQSKGI